MKKTSICGIFILGIILAFSGCETEPEHIHTEDDGTVIASTCTQKGAKIYKCNVCGEVLKTEEIDAIGHTEDKGTMTVPVTFTTDGTKTYKCSVCETELRTETIKHPDFNCYESPVDVSTGKAATSSSKNVYFGIFPKTVLAANSTVTVDETESVTMGAHTYYKGSDGEWYAKVTANPFDTYYTYTDGNKITETTAYFKVEPVKWTVVTTDYNGTGNSLLLAEEILTANVPFYDCKSSSNTRTVENDSNIYANNYKYSQIRAYLNGLDYYYDQSSTETEKKTDYTDKGFLQTVFTTTAQALIEDTEVINDGSSTTDAKGAQKKADGSVIKSGSVENEDAVYYPDYTCDNTIDKLFLLSEKEVTTTEYGFATYKIKDNTRALIATDYALANHAQKSSESTRACWWLRSPFYTQPRFSCYVNFDGSALWCHNVYYTCFGIVPALTILIK